MDALRKAEQQKQDSAVQGQPPRQADVSAKLELEPLSTQVESAPAESRSVDGTGKTGTTRLPELPTRLEDLDEQFIASAAKIPQQATRQAVPARTAESVTAPRGNNVDATREAARAVFAAKHPAKQDSRSFVFVIGLATLVAIIGIGGYFWWQMDQMRQPQGGLVASGAAKPPPSSAPVTPVAPPAPVAVVAAPASAVPPAPTFTPPAAAKQQTPQPQSPIRVTAASQKTNPLLEQAYGAFNSGEINRAEVAWQKVLESDPRNADALYGMAAIAQQRQQPNLAADFYLRALEANPRDALALSGLISLKGHADPQQTENRLKTLLAEQPDSPFLNFALGNLYAREARWGDAQQAYFKSHVADPGNPDYLFNLAVSLDQLHQPRLAVQYYNQALGAASRQPAGFDKAQVALRLKNLQPH